MSARRSTEEPFVQVWSKLIHSGISGAALKTYMVIRETAWSVGGEYRRGNDVLAEQAEVSSKTLYRHLQELAEVGAIEVHAIGKRNNNRIEILPIERIVNVGGRSSVTSHIVTEEQGDRSEVTDHPVLVIGHGRPTWSVTDDRPIEETDALVPDTAQISEPTDQEDLREVTGSWAKSGSAKAQSPVAGATATSPEWDEEPVEEGSYADFVEHLRLAGAVS